MGQYIMMPPSLTKVEPEILEAWEESKKATLQANSSGEAARFCNEAFSTMARLFSSSHMASIMGVCVGPGTTQFVL